VQMCVTLGREAFSFNVTRFGAVRIGHVPVSSDPSGAERAPDCRAQPGLQSGWYGPLVVDNDVEK